MILIFRRGNDGSPSTRDRVVPIVNRIADDVNFTSPRLSLSRVAGSRQANPTIIAPDTGIEVKPELFTKPENPVVETERACEIAHGKHSCYVFDLHGA